MHFSVVIPVYNKAPHIRRSIDSVLSQSHGDFELIAVDDGSTDGSLEVLKQIQDDRIKILQRDTPGPGGYAARNLAIQHAQYDWISFLDADDEWDTKLLARLNELLGSFPKSEIITCGWSWVDGDKVIRRDIFKNSGLHKKPVTPFYITNFLKNPDLMWTGAVTMRKRLIESVGMFPSDKRCKKGGDLDTWIRCLNRSQSNLHVDENLAFYYRDTVNRVTNHRHNPTAHFCAYDSVKQLYEETSDKLLREAIRHFVNKNIFLITVKQIDAGHPVDSKLLKKMLFTPRSLYYVTRIAFRRLLYVIRRNETKEG